MTQKQAISICKNINFDSISDDDKFKAIEILINSQSNSMLLPKPHWVQVIKFILSAYDELEQQVSPIERVPFKPLRTTQQRIILRCPRCRAIIEKTSKYCTDCGQAIKWD